MKALCKKLSFLSAKNQLKWNGSKNDLLEFLALHLEVQPNQFRANDNGTCAVFKFQNITCNFYHKARTLQIQGKEDADKLRKDLIKLTSTCSTWAHSVGETSNAFQGNLDNDVQAREFIATEPFSPSDCPITINADDSFGGDFAKPPVSPTEDDLAKAETIIDNAYVEVILNANKSPYSNLVKDIEADYDSQLTQLSLVLKKVSNELIDLKASHAALLAANNEITNELTALRNDVTSHLQTQLQRIPETNDLKDSHAALLVATNEIANEVINLRNIPNKQQIPSINYVRNDITSYFQKPSHILPDSQGWTSVGKNRRPIDIQNKFKALEISDDEISPEASDAKPDENSSEIINADRSTPMTLTDQLAEYRLQHKQQFISQFTTAISESSTQPSIANSTVTAINSSEQVPVSADKPTKACLIGDSLVKNIEPEKLSRACRGKTIVECSRGAKIKDIHKKANEFLASGHIDGNTALIVHCGTNDLAAENEDAAATKLRMLINDLKPKTKSLAISAVTLRNDSATVTTRKVNRFNRLTETICEQTNVCFIDNRNILAHHLNRSNLHLNSSGSKVLGSNLCGYLRRANLPPSGQELTTKLATGFRQNHFRVRIPFNHTTMWTNYLSQVREMTNH